MNLIPEVLEIEELRLPVILERGKRKTLTLQVTQELQLWIKAPIRMPEREIVRFINQRIFWIYKHAKRMQKDSELRVCRSDKEIYELREKARMVLTGRTEFFAGKLGVTYNKIRIGSQRTRWGSCSSKGTISYNWKLILMPEAVRDYVVVHELCHLLEMNHSPQFWKVVEEIIPNYKEYRRWLKENGSRY
ncbi:MAG: M48 family metallopeptidase [Lachnospiraceae bacterium]|nr:M48 family metallopeptidase [Lachnospiraceae bacterium]